MVAVTPHVNDVLFGRGAAINIHPGNQQFRALVDSHKKTFLNAPSKKQKRAIATIVYNEILSLQPPGRFLVEDRSLTAEELNNDSATSSNSNVHHTILKRTWAVVEPDKALVKIMHRMRERDKEEKALDAMQPGEVREFHAQKMVPSKSPPAVKIKDASKVEDSNSQEDQLATENVIQNQHSPQISSSKYDFIPQIQLGSETFGYSSTEPQSSESSSSIRGGAATEMNSESSRTNLRNYLEGIGLDFDADFLLHESNPLQPDEAYEQIREYTLRQWIMTSKPVISFNNLTSAQSSAEVAEYIKSALLIALKLIECILEAEKDERRGHGNPIPLASIAPENVLIRARKGRPAIEESEELETIEFVWIMSIVGDRSATGTVMTRLFAVGKVLYELFSTNAPMLDDDTPASHMVSMDSINLCDVAEHDYHSRKKSHWRTTQNEDNENSEYVADLTTNGVPWSLCALVRHLLECRHDLFCEDDAYTSFDDLLVDLQLMIDNPSCFLDNIYVSNLQKVEILDKLYGRDEELLKLEESYQSHIANGSITGAVISGGAGEGKSKLATHTQKLTIQASGSFLSAKFEQHQMSLKPMSTIAKMFDSLCEMLFNESLPSVLTSVENELISALGAKPGLLVAVPNLRKLMPSCARCNTPPSDCVDAAESMRYLCGELLRVISSHLMPITIVIDDIQFADPASLLLVGSLLFSAQGAPIFFVLCHRDDEASMSESFKTWLTSIELFSMEPIKLESITAEAVNNLISDALRVSPRLTRPLSSVLHRKSRGNPLFLRQLLDSLREQGYISFDMKKHRWAWDLDAITELEISDSVLALLMNDIQRLPSDLQFGLQIASCIGSCVTEPMLNCLSTELGLNLKNILQQASEKGFMIDIAGSTMFRFAHDKIQEAVYELMTEQPRRENHMRFGLALCTQSLINIAEDEELFFAAVNQINQGGPTAVHEPSQRNIIAQLNLKAGRRSIELSDYNSAFKLLQHGISFLSDDHWRVSYQLSLDLYDAVVEVSLILNKLSTVTFYSNEVISHAGCFDDKLHCLSTAAKALGVAYHHEQSVKSSLSILVQFGEDPPRSMGDDTLRTDIDKMNYILQSTSDDMIYSMQGNNDKKMATLVNLYANLAHVVHYFQPWLVGSVSLRMVAVTIKTGLSSKSPLAFAHFGGVLSSIGYVNEGCRLGKLALKLVEKKGSLQYKSSVICFVYNTILWASEPLQSIVEAHLLGHKAGQLTGDIVFALHNLILAILTDYVAGKSLDTVQKNAMDFVSVLNRHGLKIFFKNTVLLLSQISVLSKGPNAAQVNNMPSEGEILSDASSGPSIAAYGKLHHLTRAFLFQQMYDASLHVDISGAVSESHHQLNPHYLMGYFFEGLASFQFARQTRSSESAKWMERGQSVLAKMRCWSEHSLWNWENKVLLLEAEDMFANGEIDSAGRHYNSAIRSAREHKFIHEEAIASELAGMFYFEIGLQKKSYSYLVHSVDCYEKWGAHAVAKRVENVIKSNFGRDIELLEPNADTSLEHIFASSQESKKKRQQRECKPY